MDKIRSLNTIHSHTMYVKVSGLKVFVAKLENAKLSDIQSIGDKICAGVTAWI